MKNFTDYTINKNAKCLDALKKLDSEKSNLTLFVIDDNNKLIGTVTDGDIRRGLIRGLNIETEIHLFGNPNFCFIDGEINVSEIRRLKKEGIKLLPRLNETGQIKQVYNLSKLNSILPIQAVIMAGGRGERLRPLTDHTPKPMLLLGSKPIIEYSIDRLISFGIENITISVRYLADQIMDYFGDGSSKGISINYIIEEIPLGTIGCLSSIDNSKHETILVINSDIFTSLDFEDFYINFYDSNADMAVASIPYSVDIPYAIMDLDDNRIISFREKPKNTYYANAGIYIIKKNSLNLIPKNSFFNATDLMESVIENQGKLTHWPITGYWIDIGQMDDYNKAQEIIKHI